MCGKTLDEEGHGDDKANTHQEDSVPVGLKHGHDNQVPGHALAYRHPLCYSEQGPLVEK